MREKHGTRGQNNRKVENEKLLSKKVVLKENFGSNHDKQSTYILDDKNQTSWVFGMENVF